MKAEQIIEVLKDVAPGRDVVNIIVKKDEVTIETVKEITNSERKVKKTKICKELADCTVGELQTRLHKTYEMLDNTLDLEIFEKILRIEDKAYRMYKILKEGD